MNKQILGCVGVLERRLPPEGYKDDEGRERELEMWGNL